jgi:hypothetical protein
MTKPFGEPLVVGGDQHGSAEAIQFLEQPDQAKR